MPILKPLVTKGLVKLPTVVPPSCGNVGFPGDDPTGLHGPSPSKFNCCPPAHVCWPLFECRVSCSWILCSAGICLNLCLICQIT